MADIRNQSTHSAFEMDMIPVQRAVDCFQLVHAATQRQIATELLPTGLGEAFRRLGGGVVTGTGNEQSEVELLAQRRRSRPRWI